MIEILLLGIFALFVILVIRQTNKNSFSFDIEKKIKDKKDEYSKKPAADIIDILDTKSDIDRIKRESDDEFDKIKNRKHNGNLDRP